MSIIEKIKNGDYYPKTIVPNYPSAPASDCGHVINYDHNFCPACGIPIKNADKIADYYRARDAFHAEDTRLLNQFKTDALKETGLTKSPWADALWCKAWEDGQDSGYLQIWYHLIELAEIFTRINTVTIDRIRIALDAARTPANQEDFAKFIDALRLEPHITNQLR